MALWNHTTFVRNSASKLVLFHTKYVSFYAVISAAGQDYTWSWRQASHLLQVHCVRETILPVSRRPQDIKRMAWTLSVIHFSLCSALTFHGVHVWVSQLSVSWSYVCFSFLELHVHFGRSDVFLATPYSTTFFASLFLFVSRALKKSYLIHHWFCKFAHWQRNSWPILLMVGR